MKFSALATIFAAVFVASLPLCADNLPVTNHVLPDGVRLLIEHDPDTQLVAIDVFVRTAGAPEDAAKPGLANFVARTLLTGTSNQNSTLMSHQIGVLGGNIAASWDRNMTEVKALTLASQFGDTAYLLSDVIKNANFDSGAVEDARKDLLRQFQDQSDDVFQQTYDQMKVALYQGDGITATDLGSASVVRSVRPAELRAFYEKYYTADNIVISVVGNVDPAEVVKTFGDDLSDFDRHSTHHGTVLPTDITPLPKPVTVKTYRGDLTSGYVMLGYVVPGAGSKEYTSMLLLNALLGGMKTSLLFTNLREKQGLGYETASIYGEDVTMTDLAAFIVSSGDAHPPAAAKLETAAATPAVTGPTFSAVRDALLDQVKLMRDQPPTDVMLQRAKKYVTGSYLIRHERLLDRAYWLGFSETALQPVGGYKFDTNFAENIDAVSASDIQHAAQKYLSSGYVVSMVLPGDPKAGEVSR